ncbi:DUF1574 domain-containing protein [Leptospira idonii]|uniref:DUF1574 domain-containing protein n=1 Tax=Leptospira idonii TaxID=1193500 RepID=A0A4R9LYU8_9LEPT|nr:DUF1574 domain-containing protein [Leptospira idonii]TGN17979.1 DUF1574 domain-containing protein [Leptospira idonii]
MFSRPFLFYPLILLASVLIIDKIFLLPVFHKEFLQAGNSVFYHHRKVLADRLEKDPKIKETKLALVFGDSRSYPFSELGIPAEKQSSWSLYNFSGPQGIPMYSYIWLNDLLQRGIQPQFIILSLSPEAFDDSKGFINTPFLRLGCDSECVDLVWQDIPWKDKYEFYLDRAFSIRSVELNLSLFFSRLKSGKLKEYTAFYNPEYRLVNYAKGDYLMYATTANPTEKLERDSKRISALYMKTFQLGKSQTPYVEAFLKLTREKGIKTVVIWPKVYGKYYKEYEKHNIGNVWWAGIKNLAVSYGASAIDMNSESNCELFNDASHQSVLCFVDQTKMIWDKYADPSFNK